jgi:hypothetical protein
MIALALGAVACGGEDGADESAVKRRVNGLYDAFAAKDASKVCDSLTEERQREIEGRSGGRSCSRTLDLLLSFRGSDLRRLRKAEVTDVSIDGDMATATVEYKGRGGVSLGLTKQSGDWKVSDFDLSGVR